MTDFAQLLLDAGLIQFGWFQRDGALCPFSLDLDMIASYPRALERAAVEAQAALAGVQVDRLLCTADAVPFGTALSLRTGIPLVYSRGSTDAPVFDLVGAYDIGHPAALVTNALGWGHFPADLIKGARRVGLEVHTIVPILEARHDPAPDGLSILPLLRLADLAHELHAAGQLAPEHAQAVSDWLNS